MSTPLPEEVVSVLEELSEEYVTTYYDEDDSLVCSCCSMKMEAIGPGTLSGHYKDCVVLRARAILAAQ